MMLIRAPYGIQAVGDDQEGLSTAELADGFLDVAFIVRIHAGRGLVQDHNGSVL